MADLVAKVEQGKSVIEAITAAVALGGGLLGWAGFVVSSRSKRREEKRTADRDSRADEQKLRDDRDKYHEKWTDCEEEKVRLESEIRGRIRTLEAQLDEATAKLRSKSEELHDAQAYARTLNVYCYEALDELTHAGLAFRPIPPPPAKPQDKE